MVRNTSVGASHREAIIFNQQLITVYVEHKRLLSHFLKTYHSLTFNEFTLMLSLHECDKPTAVRPLAEFMMLGHKTVLAILLALEDRGLIVKTNSTDDGRKMLVLLTAKGVEKTLCAHVDLNELAKKRFWASLPQEDFELFMAESIVAGVDSLRGYAVEGFDHAKSNTASLSVAFFIYWRVIVERWTGVVRQSGSLSFNEYRILSLLEELGPLSPLDLSNRLFIQRSGVTAYKRRLLAEGLIEESPSSDDGRSVTLRHTKKGRRLAKGISEKLNDIARMQYSHLADENIMVLNAWHLHMYSNLMLGRRNLGLSK